MDTSPNPTTVAGVIPDAHEPAENAQPIGQTLLREYVHLGVAQNDGSMQVGLVDAELVDPSPLRVRQDPFINGLDFEELKKSIAVTAGNVQPIAVRISNSRYEVIFGHRRYLACLELDLPILAVIFLSGVSDQEVIQKMDFENRNRSNPSFLEIGRHYKRLIDAKVYENQTKLASALNVSHTWVGQLLALANLPAVVTAAFIDPHKIQPVQAKRLTTALALDEPGVTLRARNLAANDAERNVLKVTQVVKRLLGEVDPGKVWQSLFLDDPGRGDWRQGIKGVVELRLPSNTPDRLLDDIRSVLNKRSRQFSPPTL